MQKIRSFVMRLSRSLPHFDAGSHRSGNRGHHGEHTQSAFDATLTGITLACGLLYIANIVFPSFGFRWNSPYLIFFVCCDIGMLIFLRSHPQGVSIAMILLWTAERYVPWNLPYTYVFAVLAAAATLGYLRFRLALGTCLVSTLVLFFIRVSSLGSTVLMSLVFLAVSCCGFAFRLYKDRNHAISQLNMHRRQEMIAGKLHDVVCNDLAYALRQMDSLEIVALEAAQRNPTNKEDCAGSLSEIRHSLTEALQYTRTAITTLQSSDGESHGIGRNGDSTDKTTLNITALLDQEQKKLNHIGISGIIAAPDMGNVEMPRTTAAIIEGLIREIFGNLLKYADPAKGYVLTTKSDGITLHIGISDSPRPDAGRGAPSNAPSDTQPDAMFHGDTGIRSYQARLASMGGELSISASDDQWTMQAAIPLIPSFR